MEPISIASSALEDRVIEPSSRRVFLPVAPSFARKLHLPDDVSSVDSFDDRRYSDVPSARSLTAFTRSSPVENTTPGASPRAGAFGVTGLSFGARSPSSSESGPSAGASSSTASHVQPPTTVRPQPVRVSPLPSPIPPQTSHPKTRRSWRRLLPRLRGGSNNNDTDKNKERRTTCLPRKTNRRGRAGATASDRPRSSAAEHDASFARLPKLGAVDVTNEPHSFAGFRQKPWYLLSEEGSSVSSSEWDVSVRAPSSFESRQHRMH